MSARSGSTGGQYTDGSGVPFDGAYDRGRVSDTRPAEYVHHHSDSARLHGGDGAHGAQGMYGHVHDVAPRRPVERHDQRQAVTADLVHHQSGMFRGPPAHQGVGTHPTPHRDWYGVGRRPRSAHRSAAGAGAGASAARHNRRSVHVHRGRGRDASVGAYGGHGNSEGYHRHVHSQSMTSGSGGGAWGRVARPGQRALPSIPGNGSRQGRYGQQRCVVLLVALAAVEASHLCTMCVWTSAPAPSQTGWLLRTVPVKPVARPSGHSLLARSTSGHARVGRSGVQPGRSGASGFGLQLSGRGVHASAIAVGSIYRR